MEINQSNHTDRNSKHNGGRGGTEQAVENNYGTRRKPQQQQQCNKKIREEIDTKTNERKMDMLVLSGVRPTLRWAHKDNPEKEMNG